jgi:adenosyl cobinamide kinase/adenosyl cobinamide phosphate guanylyltransferase
VAKQLSWKEQRDRDDLAARKKEQEAKSDPVLEQCVIEYISAVQKYGPRAWEQFRREWLVEHAKMTEMKERAKQKASTESITIGSESRNG